MLVTASHWWNRGKSMLVRRTEVPVATSHSSLVSTIISRPMMLSQASFSQTRSHKYAVADRPSAPWRDLGYVELGQLSVGEPWIWATRAGLEAFGLKSRRFQPGKSWLRHTR